MALFWEIHDVHVVGLNFRWLDLPKVSLVKDLWEDGIISIISRFAFNKQRSGECTYGELLQVSLETQSLGIITGGRLKGPDVHFVFPICSLQVSFRCSKRDRDTSGLMDLCRFFCCLFVLWMGSG